MSIRRSGVDSGAGDLIPPDLWVGVVVGSSLLVAVSPGSMSGELKGAGEKPTSGRVFIM